MFKNEKPNAVVIFQDPKFFVSLLADLSGIIRQTCPIVWITVWDSHLVGSSRHFNEWLYQSVDHLSCISKQTEWFVNQVLKNSSYPESNPVVSYCGHGQPADIFKPVPKEQYAGTSKQLFQDRQYDFIALANSNNQLRKKQADLLEAWRLFNKSLLPEQAEKTCLIMHTPGLVSPWGTDLGACAQALAPDTNVVFSLQKLDSATLNHLYNLSDVVVNNSNAGGFELSVNEAMLAGRPIIANPTGGMVDQLGYVNSIGQPVPWTKEFKDNLKSYKNGSWAYPLANQRTIVGSPATPYLYDENASIESIVSGLQFWHSMNQEDRTARGLKGREFCLTQGLNSNSFGKACFRDIKFSIDNFRKTAMFGLHQI
jgi:glycosyltransferase involved in cell wall biosynthesis